MRIARFTLANDDFVLTSVAIVVIDMYVAVFLPLDLSFISNHHATRTMNQAAKRALARKSIWFEPQLLVGCLE